MKGWQWLFLVAAVTTGVVLAFVPALGGGESDVGRRYHGRTIASGDWTFAFGGGLGIVETSHPISGVGFGPGRDELAYSAPAASGGPSALWTVHISFPEGDPAWHGGGPLPVSPRLLTTAPLETTFKGPIWWSPDGTRIALRACEGESNQLVIVDSLSGEVATVPESDGVVDLAWSPGSSEVALVRAEEGKRSVWVFSREKGESRQLGAGGYDLRWSLDGKMLHWLRDDSEEVWTAVRWDLSSGALELGGPRPGRAKGALWSPNGQLCATLAPASDGGDDQIVVYSANSTVGETLSLPGLEPEKLLGWSPDSQFVLALARGNVLAVVSARPPGTGVAEMVRISHWSFDNRASVSGLPIDAEAALPTWASSGSMLVHVLGAGEVKSRLGSASGILLVHSVERKYLGGTVLDEKLERKVVDSNLKQIALGMLMYLNDWDETFPYSDDVDYLRGAIDRYLKNQSVFMRPGTDDNVVVSFTIDPGAPLSSVEDPASTPIATIDYSPEFYGIAYMDGHVRMFGKGKE